MGEMMGGMMGLMGGNMMWGGQWFGLLALAVILVVVLAVAFAIARRPSAPSGDDAHEILRRRFARGEVSAEEFESARKMLA
ncbi:MAG: SHOCT domain-containing protein [Candidatus Limnocylindria bacterium]